MTVALTAEQRDVLYEQILVSLSGIGDVWLAISAKDYDTAERLGREHADDLRLVLDDLGWGDGPSAKAVELTTPPDILQRVFSRLLDRASSQVMDLEEERAKAQTLERHNRLVMDTCRHVLTSLQG